LTSGGRLPKAHCPGAHWVTGVQELAAKPEAKVLAARVKREAGGRDANEVAAEIRRAYQVTLVRDASADEVARGVALIDTLEETDGVGPGRALELFCLMLLNTNEFAYLD
jgi:hypothetical protein